jgi:hypothetical protein
MKPYWVCVICAIKMAQSCRFAGGRLAELPLTINPAPEHNADTNPDRIPGLTGQWPWQCWLWFSLLRDAGYEDIPEDPGIFRARRLK